MRHIGFPAKKVIAVQHAILRHNRGFAKQKPKGKLSIEAKILCDADRIDALGAIGLRRMKLFSQKQGVPEFISVDDHLDESLYGNVKYLIGLADDMLTEEGKKMAKGSTRVLKLFLKKMEKRYGTD